jgi:hypothetical protein
MVADDRPVYVRTDESAIDWWSRNRGSTEVGPDFRVLKNHSNKRTGGLTPFGRQIPPRHTPLTQAPSHPPRPPRPPTQTPTTHLVTSRKVELNEMASAIREAELDKENLCHALDENKDLKTQIAQLQTNLRRALHINHALTKHMITK